MRFIGSRFFVAALGLAMLSSASQARDAQRAFRNYQAVVSGARALNDLTPEEQSEVIFVARAMARRAPSDASQECRAAREDAESKRQELEDRATRLMRCARDSDLTSDCDSEERRARYASDDFSSATSNVTSECR